MDAKEFYDQIRDEGDIIRVAHYAGDKCDGRGHGVLIDQSSEIAVMITECGNADETGVAAGAIVGVTKHPEDSEWKIVGTPAYHTGHPLFGRG